MISSCWYSPATSYLVTASSHLTLQRINDLDYTLDPSLLIWWLSNHMKGSRWTLRQPQKEAGYALLVAISYRLRDIIFSTDQGWLLYTASSCLFGVYFYPSSSLNHLVLWSYTVYMNNTWGIIQMNWKGGSMNSSPSNSPVLKFTILLVLKHNQDKVLDVWKLCDCKILLICDIA